MVAALPVECEAAFEAKGGGAHEVFNNVDPEKIPLRTVREYDDFSDFSSPVLTS